MATTAGTVQPMRPVGGSGSGKAATQMVCPVDPSVEIQNGDILVPDEAGPTGDMQVENDAAIGIFGIAMVRDNAAVTAAATIDRNGSNIPTTAEVAGVIHTVNVALAMPGQRFAGTLIANGVGDHTGVYVTDIRDPVGHNVEESTDGYACIELAADSGPCAFIMEYVSPQTDTTGLIGAVGEQRLGREAGVGLLNPRVIFIFPTAYTVFGALA